MWHIIAEVFIDWQWACATDAPSRSVTVPVTIGNYYTEDKGKPEGWDLPMIPSCVQPQDSPAMLIYWQKQGPLLCESMPVWNTAQTGYFALY